MPSLVEIEVVLEMGFWVLFFFFKIINVVSLFCYYFHFDKSMALHLNKLKFPSPNDGEIVPVILEKIRMYKQQTTDKFFSEKLTSFFLES